MPEPAGETVHASCVLVGARALLIRGPAGSGKSRLWPPPLGAPPRGGLSSVPPAARRVGEARRAVVVLVVDLAPKAAPPLPARGAATCETLGAPLPRLPVA